MKKLKSLHPQHWMALSALSTCFLIGSTASAYPLPAQDNRAAQDDRDRGGDRDQGIAGFNHFLDDHRERIRRREDRIICVEAVAVSDYCGDSISAWALCL